MPVKKSTADTDADLGSTKSLLAKRLRDWREARRYPLKHVAQEFGVSAGTWSRWEKGTRFPKAHFIPLLAKYLKVPVCEFFYTSMHQCPECRLSQKYGSKP